MIEKCNSPKISVLIITYRQEDVIGRALDSLLSQKDYIYEICINDDCSPDNTWGVIQQYMQKYPDLIKPVRNEKNVGIFENIELTWDRPTGDIIYQLSGDDEVGPGYFKAVVEFIEKNHIDWQNELFCIYGNYMQIGADGTKTLFRNSLVTDANAMKLKVRKLLSGRSSCYSKKVLEKFENVSDKRSFRVELAQDSQIQLYSEHNYYLPVLGNIYYAEIGISTKMSHEEHMENTLGGYDYFIEYLAKHGRQLDKKDLAFIDYLKAYRTGDMKKALKYFFKSIDLSLGWRGLGLGRTIYVIKKKLKR